MSANIPFDMQVEVIKKVPVKALLKFRSVSKEWKSVIDSPDFSDDYCLHQSKPHRMLIRYLPLEQPYLFPKYKYVSIAADDHNDTFHRYQFPLPKSLYNIEYASIVGTSYGVFCFYACDMAVLWNPWIRKCVDVPVPNIPHKRCETILGFGVSPQTKDPKIVKINSFFHPKADTLVAFSWGVEVFTLSSGTWKSPSCSGNNLPCRDSIRLSWDQVALNGVIYWLAFDWIKVDGRFRTHSLIMSFDLSCEGFQEVCFPDSLARLHYNKLSISKRMESVVVLEETGTSYGVWMMGRGVTKSFTRLFNVMTRGSSLFCRLRGFMKNGEPIVDHGSDALFAYDTYSERIKDLGIVGKSGSLSVKSYVETLLLMDK